jgi:hypothetical protein
LALPEDIPALTGYITLAEAADRMGLSKQALHKQAANKDLKTVRRVGERSRAVFVVKESEIDRKIEERKVEAAAKAAAHDEPLVAVPA